MSSPITTPPAAEIEYPDCDGQPMSDNTLQYRWIVTIQGNLDALFGDRPDVFVAGDLLWYPVEGNNTVRTAPDAMVAIGRPRGDRGSYMQWRENGVAPQMVWEVLSPGNRRGELQEKFDFYQRFGVEEYYQYDPDRGRLRGWLRRAGRLEEIENITQGWRSPSTGVRMRLEQGELALNYPDGRPFLSFLELAKQEQEARARADQATARAEQATIRAEQATARADQATARAGQAAARAEQATALAGREKREREAVEALLAAERREREAAVARIAAERALAEAERQQRLAADARADAERERGETARERGEAAVARAERLAARMRELGIDPEA